ncbi:type II toxin-antitoxin system PemK/MazF family toxin [Niallia sp. 01092]|uniref:type II toxin-antitoxin system PemK/MazF family toxin n=1 Tax=Niallia sp. 01092 TaxID=3457759 RepID=UPI003FD67C3E
MKFSEVLEKHIYTVHFDPVRHCEFNGRHLALVIKKNKDKKTLIVVPLTTKSNGVGVNKENIGKISTLPNNIKVHDSYVVYNQVRTVNSNRLQKLLNNNQPINCPVNDILFSHVLSLCVNELLINVNSLDSIRYHYECYTKLTIKELINTGYLIKKLLESDFNKFETEFRQLVIKVNNLWDDKLQISDNYSEVDLKSGIDTIISNCLDNSILDILNSEKKITEN